MPPEALVEEALEEEKGIINACLMLAEEEGIVSVRDAVQFRKIHFYCCLIVNGV